MFVIQSYYWTYAPKWVGARHLSSRGNSSKQNKNKLQYTSLIRGASLLTYKETQSMVVESKL